MSLRKFKRTIATGTETKIAVSGDLIFLRTATAEVLITAQASRPDSGSEVFAADTPLRERQKIKLAPGNQFDDVIVRNESGADNTIEILIGTGDYDAPLSSVNLAVPNVVLGTAAVAATAAGAQLVAANANREIAWVSVDLAGTNPVTIAESLAQAVAGAGIQGQPGMSYPIRTTAALFVARAGAANVNVSCMETQTV